VSISRDELDQNITDVVRAVIRRHAAGEQFRTTDASGDPAVVQAAGSMATERNYHAEVGQHLARVHERQDRSIDRVEGEERLGGRYNQLWTRR
jgi:hypothetical protein